MLYSDQNLIWSETGPAKIGGFEPKLTPKRLVRDGDAWYAEA